jgi:hypothetical protein
MACVLDHCSTTHFSIAINGNAHGYMVNDWSPPLFRGLLEFYNGAILVADAQRLHKQSVHATSP